VFDSVIAGSSPVVTSVLSRPEKTHGIVHQQNSNERVGKMTPDDYARRFEDEAAAMTRAYCNMFKLWRGCPFKRCRRARTCAGDESGCLKRGVTAVPRDMQWLARRLLIAATPAQAGPPERTAREFMPDALLELKARRAPPAPQDGHFPPALAGEGRGPAA
jgi:hypothetical protein